MQTNTERRRKISKSDETIFTAIGNWTPKSIEVIRVPHLDKSRINKGEVSEIRYEMFPLIHGQQFVIIQLTEDC